MKKEVLILTNLFPKKENPTSSIFMTRRLKEYRKLGVDFKAVPLSFGDKRGFVRFLRDLFRKPLNTPLEDLEGVPFEPVFVEGSFFDILTQRSLKASDKLEEFIDQFVRQILEKFPKPDLIHAYGMCLPAPAGWWRRSSLFL